VGSADERDAAADAGCAYVIAQGVEAGGHVQGRQTMVQVLDEVCSSVDVPVVAAGGIGTAEAVGRSTGKRTRSASAPIRRRSRVGRPPGHVDALVASTGADTVITETFSVGWPDAPHRVLAAAIAEAEATTADPVAEMHVEDRAWSPSPVLDQPADHLYHGRHRRHGALRRPGRRGRPPPSARGGDRRRAHRRPLTIAAAAPARAFASAFRPPR
jgi:hypothetical protein